MFLTKNEKQVICLVLVVMLAGSALRVIFAQYPFLRELIQLIDKDYLFIQIDVNTSSFDEIEAVPFIGEYTARTMIEYRQQHGGFKSVEEIKQVKGIREKNFNKFYKYLRVKDNAR